MDQEQSQRQEVHVHVHEGQAKAVHQSASGKVPTKRERELQAAKDLLAAPCHADLEWLATNSDMPFHSVLKAVKAKALGCKGGRLARANRLPDYYFGGVALAALVPFMGALLWFWAKYSGAYSTATQFSIFFAAAACLVMVWWCQNTFFYPHVVARRVIGELGGQSMASPDAQCLPRIGSKLER